MSISVEVSWFINAVADPTSSPLNLTEIVPSGIVTSVVSSGRCLFVLKVKGWPLILKFTCLAVASINLRMERRSYVMFWVFTVNSSIQLSLRLGSVSLS